MSENESTRPPELNALKHGGRSTQLIVKGETQEDFDYLNAAWREKFQMAGQDSESLLERVILNDWLLRRAERNYLNVANELGSLDPLEWTLEQHKKLELFQRYKTTAERAFSRFYNMLRALRKDRFREDMAVDKVRELMYRLALESRENEQRERNQQRWERAQKPNQAKVFFAGQNMGPTREGVPNLPRPKEQGGCDCEVCRNNQAYLDRQAAKGMQ